MHALGLFAWKDRSVLKAGIAGLVLALLAMAPAVHAASLSPVFDSGGAPAVAENAHSYPVITWEEMKFLEDNWHYDYADDFSETEPAESSHNPFSFDEMERTPGLFTTVD